MPNSNYVQKFTLDNEEILVKDPDARGQISQLNTDLGLLANRVTALEGQARLTVSYNSSTETIAFSTGSSS